MITLIQFRRGTAAEWAQADPILRQGEPGFEIDTGIIKIGDAIRRWSQLLPITGLPPDGFFNTLKVISNTYAPPGGWTGTHPYFSVGSNSPINNASNFLGEVHDFYLNQSGDSKHALYRRLGNHQLNGCGRGAPRLDHHQRVASDLF
jgi:hypothetical protein